MNNMKIAPYTTSRTPPGSKEKRKRKRKIKLEKVEKQLINGPFRSMDSVKLSELDFSGMYSIRLKQGVSLPEKYQEYLKPHRLIYIGKAEGETLKEHFCKNELKEIGQGVFLRTLSPILNYRPKRGSLPDTESRVEYTLSGLDIANIINWMRKHLEMTWIEFYGDFSLERQLVKKHTPLLNMAHYILKIQVWRDEKEHLLEIQTDKKEYRL